MATVTLRLIGTSDVHARVHPHDYYRDTPDETSGLAKTATLIAQARAEAEISLLFDNGDLIQGSPLGDWTAQSLASGEIGVHPVISAMNAMGYDAAALGNHEFNYGLDVLDAALAGAQFPFLCCNVLGADGTHRFMPWAMIEREVRDSDGVGRRLRIGVIGFVTPEIMRWDRGHLAGRATAQPVVEAARETLPALREAGADVVVALCHAGISRIGPAGEHENAGLSLAGVGGIDAIFLGHQHLMLPGADFAGIPGVDSARGRLAGVPAVMPGFWGRHVGVIDLTLQTNSDGWRVVGAKTGLREVQTSTRADSATLAATRGAHEATLAYVRSPVGEIAQPLASYFAMIGDDCSVRIVHDAQLWYARRAWPEAGPWLSAAAPFKCGGRAGPDYYTDVPAGPVSLRHIADVYLYPNGLRVVRASGATVREWLERGASVFRRLDVEDLAPQPLLAADFTPYDFDSLAGVTYQVDLTKAARYDDQGRLVSATSRRVIDLRFEGRPVDDGASFLVVTNSYRANGGGHFPGCEPGALVYEAPDSNFDALLQYVRASSPVRVESGGGWRFAPWPDSLIATLDAPAAALNHAPPRGVRVVPLGPQQQGLQRFCVIPVS